MKQESVLWFLGTVVIVLIWIIFLPCIIGSVIYFYSPTMGSEKRIQKREECVQHLVANLCKEKDYHPALKTPSRSDFYETYSCIDKSNYHRTHYNFTKEKLEKCNLNLKRKEDANGTKRIYEKV